MNHSRYYPEYEVAARELCRLRGEDPDIEVFHNADSGPLTVLYSPLWKRITSEIHHTVLDTKGNFHYEDRTRKALEAANGSAARSAPEPKAEGSRS